MLKGAIDAHGDQGWAEVADQSATDHHAGADTGADAAAYDNGTNYTCTDHDPSHSV